MGFLSRIFGTPHPQYTLDEAMKMIESDLSRLQSENLEQSYQNAMKARWEMGQLADLISEFSKKPASEIGKSSSSVKERFCLLSQKQLASLGTPEKGTPHDFLQAARLAMDNLGGLTQRQVMHINFFFKEDFRPVAKKINEINLLLPQNVVTSDHQKAVDMCRKIAKLQAQKESIETSIRENESRMKQLEQKKHFLPEVPRHPDTRAMDALEARLKTKKQEIDSFLSVQKTLKKYVYISGIKDRLAESYIESPSAALLADEELSILNYLSQASSLVNEGKIEGDRKLDIIISSAPYLKKSREELLGFMESLEAEKKKYTHDLDLFERALKDRTNLLADLEAEEKSLEKSIASEKENLERISKEISGLQAELLLLASRILDADVIL